MPILPDGSWEPPMTDKQRHVYYNCRRFNLLTGPRLSGKTIVVCHRVIRHAWETGNEFVGATIGVVADTISTGIKGPWNDLWSCMQEWIKAELSGVNCDFEIIRPPGIKGTGRDNVIQMRNMYGAIAEFQLISLEYEGDVEDKFLSTRFSCLWFSELQNFSQRSTFDIPILQLRALGIPYDQHLWISDTNPPEQGDQHFAYDLFYKERTAEEPPENITNEKDLKDWRMFQSELALFEFTIDDNPLADQRDIRNVKAAYANDPEGWDRFVLGKWIRGRGMKDKWFPEFRRNVHVIGQAEGNEESDWDVIAPSKDAVRFVLGLDTGDTNQAAVFLQQRLVNGMSYWDVLDEVLSIKEEILLTEFGERILERIEILDAMAGTPLEWVTWGDSSMERHKASSIEGNDAAIIEDACAGRVQIQFAFDAKTNHLFNRPLRRRLTLIRTLVRRNRLYVSANCRNVIETLAGLKRGKTEANYINRADPLKHAFDAMSYAIFSEMIENGEMAGQERELPKTQTPSSPRILAIKMI